MTNKAEKINSSVNFLYFIVKLLMENFIPTVKNMMFLRHYFSKSLSFYYFFFCAKRRYFYIFFEQPAIF